METSASSLLSVSGAYGSSDSFHGLKFVRNGGGGGGGGGGSFLEASVYLAPMAAATPPRKGKGVVQRGQPPPPPRCQVEGCNVDLTGVKAYYCRHKVCGMHSKSPKVVVAGMEQRFCQQCSRFHQLHEFDQGKRSCRRRLACHNKRRRKPPPGTLSSAFHEDSNGFRGFLVDFAHPKLPALARDVWQIGQAGDQTPSIRYQCGLGTPSTRGVMLMQDPGTEPIFSTPGTLHLAAGSDSSCALSLLSQPWDSTSKVNHQAISSEGIPIAEPTSKNRCIDSSWGFKGLEGSSSSTSFDARPRQVGQPENSHFSGELELAFLKRQCMGLDPSRRFRHFDDAIHWSL
ncbi:hypothetical protein OPV22_033369 [Ensete ventricosum]|uniref:SBP-type domain-containing protein n=1 Tax=Ensete ventricosum TaxID=4639 RepID=A0AAV8Q183_ENSVE|nr:hypothetical protein OPV22_033369 [Ensete ventricosum]